MIRGDVMATFSSLDLNYFLVFVHK